MRESKVENYLIKRVKENGGEIRKLKYIGYKGATDRLVLFFGFAAFVELKKPGKKPDKHQYEEHAILRQAGLNVWVIDNLETVDELIEMATR